MMMLTIKAIVDDEDVEKLLRDAHDEDAEAPRRHHPHVDGLHARLERALCSEFGRGAIDIESTFAEPFVCGACHGDRFVHGVPCPECTP
jgi:hypothetical protein